MFGAEVSVNLGYRLGFVRPLVIGQVMVEGSIIFSAMKEKKIRARLAQISGEGLRFLDFSVLGVPSVLVKREWYKVAL